MARRRMLRQRIEDQTFDLNLAPMLDMMVSLVPFLLLSIAFVRLVVIDSAVPQPVAQAIENDKNNDKRAQLKLYLFANKNARLDVIHNGKKSTYTFKAEKGAFDLAKIHGGLVNTKQKHTDVFSMEIFPEDGVPYKEIVQVMDEARSGSKDDPEFTVEDKTNKTTVKTKIMFPNITFGNVIEG